MTFNQVVPGSNPGTLIVAQIAQLVEQRTENPRVAGSIPALGTQALFRIGEVLFLIIGNCLGRLIFLTEKAGQEASDVHPM